jgi:hypothetical protein
MQTRFNPLLIVTLPPHKPLRFVMLSCGLKVYNITAGPLTQVEGRGSAVMYFEATVGDHWRWPPLWSYRPAGAEGGASHGRWMDVDVGGCRFAVGEDGGRWFFVKSVCGRMWGIVGKCGICGETPALRILVSSKKTKKNEKSFGRYARLTGASEKWEFVENVSLLLCSMWEDGSN